LDERWDGKTYWLKARVAADPDEVAKSLDSLRKDREKAKGVGRNKETSRRTPRREQTVEG